MQVVPITRRKRSSVRCRSGFTLADLVVTSLIVGILGALAAPKFANSLVRFRVESAAKRVAADLRYARQQARQAGGTQAVAFTPGQDKYELTGLSDINHAGQPFVVELLKTGYPASLLSADFGAGGTTVMFDMYGRPDNAGTVAVQVGSAQRTIAIDGASGIVSVQP